MSATRKPVSQIFDLATERKIYHNNKAVKKVHRGPNDVLDIYPIERLKELLEYVARKQLRSSEDDTLGFYAVRFVLLGDGTFLFAENAPPTKRIPGHGEMARQCISAGVFFFNSDYQLVAISNKTSWFECHFQSLQFALEAMLGTAWPHSPELQLIDERDKENKHTVNVEELKIYLRNLHEPQSSKGSTILSTPQKRKHLEVASPSFDGNEENVINIASSILSGIIKSAASEKMTAAKKAKDEAPLALEENPFLIARRIR